MGRKFNIGKVVKKESEEKTNKKGGNKKQEKTKEKEKTPVFNSLEEALAYEQKNKKQKEEPKKQKQEKVNESKKNKTNKKEKLENIKTTSNKNISKEELKTFINREKEKEYFQTIKKITEANDYKVEWPTLEEIMEFKLIHNKIFLINLGERLSYEELQEAEDTFFILKPLNYYSYSKFVTNIGDISKNLGLFYEYIIQNNILYPKMTHKKLKETPGGVVDSLSKIILSESKFNQPYIIQRV